MKKLSEILQKTGLKPEEILLIKKISLICVISCIIVVGIVWVYYFLKLKPVTKTISSESKELSVTSLTPLDVQAHCLIGETFLKRGKPTEAIPHFKRAFAISKEDPLIQYQLSVALLEAGFLNDALTNLAHLTTIEIPDSLKAPVCIKTGMAYFYLGDITNSTQKLKECLSQFPNSSEALCFMGQIETYNPVDSQKARNFLELAIQLDSSSVEAWYQLGRFEMTYGDSLLARKHFLHALKLDPIHVKSHARLGMLYYYMDNTELAQSCYRTALTLNPADFNTRYNLGELLYTAGDTIQALKEFTQTLSNNPDHVEANFRVGMISLTNNMTKEAINYFKNALKKDPFNIRILLQLAISFEKIDLTPDAIDTYKQILTIDELHPIARQKIKLLTQQKINSTIHVSTK